jgi:GST-like protein
MIFSLPAPNGVKVSSMLEEPSVPFDSHKVGFASHDQMSPEFLSLNPNNKMSAILDPAGPKGVIAGAVRVGRYTDLSCRKCGKFLSEESRYEAIQCLMFQMGGIEASAWAIGGAIKGAQLDDGRRLHHRRYSDVSVGAKSGGVRRFSQCGS